MRCRDRRWWVAPACWALLAVSARAGIVVATHDWDTNPDPNNWASRDGWVTVSESDTGGNSDHWLNITFPATDPEDPDGWWDTVSTPADSLYAGNWSTTNWIEFDFWASNTEPRYVQVRFASTNDPTRVWRYTVYDSDVDSMNLLTWNNTSLTADFSNWENWRVFSPGYTEANYLADLQNIDWIGVYIYRYGAGEQTYGIDNFRLMIPEPGSCLLLAAAFVSSALSLRRKRKKGR